MSLYIFFSFISHLLFLSKSIFAVELALSPAQQQIVSINSEQNIIISEALKSNWVETGGLELIVAGSSKENVEGQFGHLALRLVGSGSSELTDLVIEAMGIPSEEDGSFKVKYKGISGKYPIIFLFTDIKQQIKNYYKNEVRGYYRLPLPSDILQRRDLIANMSRISSDQFRGNTYRFFSQNCATFLLDLLESSGFHQAEAIFPMRPTQVFSHFRKSFLTPWPENMGVDVLHLQDLAKALTLRGISSVDTLSLQRMLAFSQDSMDESLREIAKKEIKMRSTLYDASVVYDVRKYPNDFYQLTLSNPSNVKQFIQDEFSRKSIKNISIYNRASMTTLYPGQYEKVCRKIKSHCDYFEQGTLLLQEVFPTM